MKVRKHNDGSFSLHVSREELDTLRMATSQASVPLMQDRVAVDAGRHPSWAFDRSRELTAWDVEYAHRREDENDALFRALDVVLHPPRREDVA